LEVKALKYVIIEKFLINLKKELGRGNNEIIKMMELEIVEQGSRTIEEFV